MSAAVVRGLCAAGRLGAWLARGPRFHGSFVPLAGPLEGFPAGLEAPPAELGPALEDLPEGPARFEAAALRLRRRGLELCWRDDVEVAGVPELLEFCARWGASSVEVWRSDPSLLPGMRLGAYWQAAWRARLVRRLLHRSRGAARAVARLGGPLALRTAADLAFWGGVAAAATAAELAHLTRSSYVALCYHRLAGEHRPGQERLDVSPARLRTHLRVLRLLGYRPLGPAEQLALHRGDPAACGRRRFVLTVDDATADVVAPLLTAAPLAPQLFVPTAIAGGRAWWVGDEPVAGWDELRALAGAGVLVGGHGRTHARLTDLGAEALMSELRGSREDLDAAGLPGPRLLAYPFGGHDAKVRAAAIAAGYEAAYTTEVGRNGPGTDPWCLRRIGIHHHDGPAALAWKALTGELLPRWWAGLRRHP